MTEQSSLPPHDTNAEHAVIGSVLKDPSSVGRVGHLMPQEFYHRANGAIWKAMRDLWDRNQPIGYVTLTDRLSHPDLTGENIGLLELAEFELLTPTSAHIEHYAQIVSDAATRRQMIHAAQTIAEKSWRNDGSISDLLMAVEAAISAARPNDHRRELYDPKRWAEEFWDDLDQRQNGHRQAIETNLIDLNAMTLGYEPGSLYLFMSTPGSGKTEIAMQIAMYAGAHYGPGLFASLEMRAQELAQRYARISYGMDRNHLASGKLDERELNSMGDLMAQMQISNFWPSAPSKHYTTADLRADAMEVRARCGRVNWIVADYVQRFRDKVSPSSPRHEDVGRVAENLKSLAREFQCPVIAPVQPNREYHSRGDRRPQLSDLGESSKLEQEADVVLGMYRPEKHGDLDPKNRGVCEIHMLKNRSGAGDTEGMRKLVWTGHCYGNFAGARDLP